MLIIQMKKVINKKCDISNESEINNLIDEVNEEFGLIDIFCSNAGILTLGDEQSTNEDWRQKLEFTCDGSCLCS